MERLEIPNVSMTASDLFSNVDGAFDGIVANLPYVPEGERATMARELLHDPALALFSGTDGLDLIRRFVPEAFRHLKPGGWLVMEIGHDQASLVAGFLETSGFTEVAVKKDLSGVARFPCAMRPL
jgi:release factor glutamine methyltransferase